jgi:hypothetical protein
MDESVYYSMAALYACLYVDYVSFSWMMIKKMSNLCLYVENGLTMFLYRWA